MDAPIALRKGERAAATHTVARFEPTFTVKNSGPKPNKHPTKEVAKLPRFFIKRIICVACVYSVYKALALWEGYPDHVSWIPLNQLEYENGKNGALQNWMDPRPNGERVREHANRFRREVLIILFLSLYLVNDDAFAVCFSF